MSHSTILLLFTLARKLGPRALGLELIARMFPDCLIGISQQIMPIYGRSAPSLPDFVHTYMMVIKKLEKSFVVLLYESMSWQCQQLLKYPNSLQKIIMGIALLWSRKGLLSQWLLRDLPPWYHLHRPTSLHKLECWSGGFGYWTVLSIDWIYK